MALAMSMPVFSQTTSTSFGRPDCGQWIAAKRQNQNYNSWLAGYVSGLNYMYDNLEYYSKDKPVADKLGTVSSLEQIFLWVDNYCQKNPLENLVTAGSALMIELINK